MSKYAFLFMDDGVDYQTDPTPEQQKVYADIFKWFEVNGSKITNGGAELQPTRTATTIRKSTGKVTVVDGPFKTWPGYGIEIRELVEQRERVTEG